MGLLIDGQWHDHWYDTESNKGRFIRSDSQFRHWVTATGEAGPSGQAGFKAEPGRYHLYVSLACPWASRAVIFRKIKGLESLISLSVVHWHMGEYGWYFSEAEGTIPDSNLNAKYLHEIYTHTQADYSGRVTVPVLWDKQQRCIVSNESADIIRMFNSAFDHCGATEGDYYPQALREDIDRLNAHIYDTVNNGVYRAGFATTQAAYDEAVQQVFTSLGELERRLADQRYVCGDHITEADWRLFTTLVRFDAVYFGHFKCNIKQLRDYSNIWAYTRDLYAHPGIAETVNMVHIKQHYYGSHPTINPTGIVPLGPLIDFEAPQDRAQRFA